ncbi:hypothetical protein MferCBS31731_003225 [Microsporum ferrugineum]
MWLLTLILDYGAPPLLVLSPVLSYSDQIMSIHRKKTSAGFSLDIPLIMLVASIFKIFYWFGAYYSVPLLVQAISMIAVQVILLKVALDNRPSSGIEHTPFNGQGSESGFVRPYRFWQWKTARPYWIFLVYFTLSLLAIHILLPPVSNSHAYIELLGFSGLGIEAFLPIPQIISNQRSRSCEGFRPSALVSWLLGDAMKMSFFFFSGSSIPLAFRICGVFQCLCDIYLGFQFYTFGDWRSWTTNDLPSLNRWGMKSTDVQMTQRARSDSF